MLAYVIRRVALVIPTIFIVLILSFLLKSSAPGDEVARQLELEGASITLSKRAYMQEYKKISSRLGLDQPSFYITLLPSYFPDTLHRLQPKEKRRLFTSMVRQTKEWAPLDRLNSLLDSAVNDQAYKQNNVKLIHTEILKIEQDRSLSRVKDRCRKISEYIAESDNLPGYVSEILSIVNGLQGKSAVSYPVFKWNGSKNQFHFWTTRIFGKNNTSLLDKSPVIPKIFRALKWTIFMSLVTLILVAILSLILGYTQTFNSERFYDKFSSFILYILFAVPSFWLASLMVIFFTSPEYGTWTDIFPSIGLKPSFVEQSFMTQLSDNLGQLLLPIICMTLSSLSYLTFQLKSDLMDALSKPYILMARAKGLNPHQILRSHALPNALVPYITILTGSIPGIFAGTVIIEVIFNIPGIGRLLFRSVQGSDWPIVFTIVIVISLATMISYLLGDLLLMKLYPKTRRNFNDLSTAAE